jgi:hypothetical protein
MVSDKMLTYTAMNGSAMEMRIREILNARESRHQSQP